MPASPHLRLFGRWKSDRRRTLMNCHRYHLLPEAKKRRFGSIFGRLRLRYTPKFIFTELQGIKWRSPYEIITEDAQSVVIRIHPDGINRLLQDSLVPDVAEIVEPTLQHIHLVTIRRKEYYWIGIGIGSEWFVRE